MSRLKSVAVVGIGLFIGLHGCCGPSVPGTGMARDAPINTLTPIQQRIGNAASLHPCCGAAAIAFDTNGDLILFGGVSDGGLVVYGDTWAWDGMRWKTVQTTGSSPSERYHHAMVYDSKRKRVVLFGGRTAEVINNETWEWDGLQWEQKRPEHSPSARFGHSMAFDSTRGVTVLFGGHNGNPSNDTWEWNGSDWTLRASDVEPPTGRYFQAMCYDRLRQRIVLHGGVTGPGDQNDETWEWDGSSWTMRTINGPVPRARSRHCLEHRVSVDRSEVILHGGTDGQQKFSDTWRWDGEHWELVADETPPPFTHEPSIVYDAEKGVIILVGDGQTWLWNGETWQQWLEPPSTYAIRPVEMTPPPQVGTRSTLVFELVGEPEHDVAWKVMGFQSWISSSTSNNQLVLTVAPPAGSSLQGIRGTLVATCAGQSASHDVSIEVKPYWKQMTTGAGDYSGTQVFQLSLSLPAFLFECVDTSSLSANVWINTQGLDYDENKCRGAGPPDMCQDKIEIWSGHDGTWRYHSWLWPRRTTNGVDSGETISLNRTEVIHALTKPPFKVWIHTQKEESWHYGWMEITIP